MNKRKKNCVEEKCLEEPISSVNSNYLWPVGLWAFTTTSFCLFECSMLSYTDFIKQTNIFRFFLRNGILETEKASPFPHDLYTPQHTVPLLSASLYCSSRSSTIFMLPHLSYFFSHNAYIFPNCRGFH